MKLKYIILICLFIVPFSVNADHIYNLDMNMNINSSGDANVIEKWDVKASNGTEWYKSFVNMKETSVTNYEVYIDGQLMKYSDNWDINASLKEKKGYYGINNVDNGIELCFGKGDKKRHVFTIKYDLKNVIYTTSDSQILYYTLFQNVDADNFEVTISSYYDLPNDLRVSGYGYKGYINVKNGKIYMRNIDKLKDEYVTVLSAFPLNTFTNNNRISEYADYNSVWKIAEEGSYKYKYNDDKTNMDKKNTKSILQFSKMPFLVELIVMTLLVLLIVFGPILIIIILIIVFNLIKNYIKSKLKKKKRYISYKNNEIIKNKNIPLYRDIPCNKDINYANALIYLNGFNYNSYSILGAIILKWVYEDRIQFTNNNKVIVLHKRKQKFTSKAEEDLFSFFIEASDNNSIAIREFKKYCKRHKIRPILNVLKNEAVYKLEKNGSITKNDKKNKIKYIGNDVIYQDSINLYGLKEYLINFSNIEDKDILDVKLWNEYLMFAYLFGVSKKVIKQFKKMNLANQKNLDISYNILNTINKLVNFNIRTDYYSSSTSIITNSGLFYRSFSENKTHSSLGGGSNSIGSGGSMGGR